MSFTGVAAKYADDVVAGDIPACLYVVQACQRFQRDAEKIGEEGFPYKLDFKKAEKWCNFLQTLPHVKGKWAAKNELFVLSPWQVFIVVNLFAWVHIDTGFRRFRECYIEIPRKNGKSYLVAGIGVGFLCLEKDAGTEIYTGAQSEAQAWEVFRPAKQICERKAALRNRYGIEVNAKSLNRLSVGGRFQPLIGKPGDGSSPSLAIADEMHEHPDSDQIDTMITGMGARDEPLMLYITTAGVDMGGPCYDKRADIIEILKQTVDDDRVFGIVYGIDEDEPWDTVEAQIKANPNYGVSVNADFLEGQLKQARRSPTKQSSYKTKHLNQWVGAKAAWMNMLAFQACRKKDLTIDDFKGRPCYIGIDLASKIDIASCAVLFPPEGNDRKYSAFVKHYLPEDTILESNLYQGFHGGGWLTSTPGNVTDFAFIEDDLKLFKSEYQVTEILYDPFQATQFSTRMLAEGFPMIEYGATVKNFSEPMKQLEALILQQGIQFDFDPVLNWMMGNVEAREDAKSNIFPRKAGNRAQSKIDGVVALIMALARTMPTEEANPYDTRGLRVIEG